MKVLAPADQEGPAAPGENFGPFGPFGRDLNLTDDQRTAIQKIGESFRETDRALLDQMRTLHESQREFDERRIQ